MAPTRKEETKTDLDHALRICIDEREGWQLALETQSVTPTQYCLDKLSEKWERVVTANLFFVDNRDESDALELEIFDNRYQAERRKIFNITNGLELEEITRPQQAARLVGYSHPPAPSSLPTKEQGPVQLSIPAPLSCSSSQDPSSLRQPPSLSNGSAVTGIPGLLQPTDEFSAYTQLQQLTAAFCRDATTSAKDGGRTAAPSTTNNSNLYYPYTPSTTTASTSSASSSYSSSSLGRGDFSNDQIAAALLNGFGGKFSLQLLMEMPSMPRSGQQGQAYQQRAGFTSALVQSMEQTKPSSKTRMATPKASQLEAKPNTVKADRLPPDPDPGPEAAPGPKLSKVTTTRQVYELPNIPRPSSSRLYLFRRGFSPNRSLSTQSGPTPAGSNNPGHGNDSNLPICPPPSVRAPVPDGQPRGQPVRVHAQLVSDKILCGRGP